MKKLVIKLICSVVIISIVIGIVINVVNAYSGTRTFIITNRDEIDIDEKVYIPLKGMVIEEIDDIENEDYLLIIQHKEFGRNEIYCKDNDIRNEIKCKIAEKQGLDRIYIDGNARMAYIKLLEHYDIKEDNSVKEIVGNTLKELLNKQEEKLSEKIDNLPKGDRFKKLYFVATYIFKYVTENSDFLQLRVR